MNEELLRAWRTGAEEPGAVLLDGFHPLKHALRFGGAVRQVLTADRAALLALAAELAPDVAPALDALAVELPEAALRTLAPRLSPTGVVALAVRPTAEANRAALAVRPRPAPVVLLENPRNLGNVGAVIRLAAASARPAWSPPANWTPGTPPCSAAARACTSPPPSNG